MDYFMDVLRFWALSVELLSMEGQKALGFHQKYLNLCTKMNEGLAGLEWYEGKSLMTEFSF